MDMGDDASDFSMTAFISFPQVLGHEVVADVVEVGPEVRGLEIGQRVVLQCWLSCGPRGITPLCPACEAGDYSLCWSFTDGRLTPGIHVGNSSDATGGFAELLPAHDSMAIPIPDDVPDEVAVLADPFAVSLHSITRNPPPPGGQRARLGRGRARHVRDRRSSRVAVPRRRGRRRRAPPRAAGARPEARCPRDRRGTRRRAARRRARGVVGWPAPPAVGRTARSRIPATSTSATTRSRHRRRSSSRCASIAERGTIALSGVHAAGRFEWSPVVLQGGADRRVERLRDRGGRRCAQARDRALPRPRARRAASTSARC